MGDIDADAIHTALADRLGTSLRAVIRYDGERIDSTARADVEDEYDDIRQLVDNNILHQLDAEEVEQAFRLGTLEAVVRVFERSWVVRVADGPKRGCLFSVERDDDVTMRAIEDGIAIVEEELRD